MSTVAHQAAGGHRAGVSRGALWFGLLGGAVAWTFHLMLAYAIAEFGCVGRLGERSYGGISLVAWLLLVLTAATVLAAAVATGVAYRSHRRLQSTPRETDVAGAMQNAAWAGVLTSGTFTFVIFFESIPIVYYLHGC